LLGNTDVYATGNCENFRRQAELWDIFYRPTPDRLGVLGAAEGGDPFGCGLLSLLLLLLLVLFKL
jgi:hypothetical protein